MPRSISTVVLTLTVAVMVGVREATGLAPPPPALGNEEIVWLAPERDGDPGYFLVLEDPEFTEAGPAAATPPARPGLLRRLLTRLRPSRP